MAATKVVSSPSWVAIALLTLLVVAGGCFYGYYAKTAALQRNTIIRRDIEALRNKNLALAPFNNDELHSARERADLFRATLLSPDRVAAFQRDQSSFWSVSEGGSERTSEYEKKRYEMVRTGALMSDWPKILESVKSLQSTPGMTVRRLEIITSGDQNQRSFDRVVLGVTLFVRLPKNS